MAQLPGMNVKLIRLNPEWSVENAASTPLEQNLSINDFNGKRLIITLPGAGGCVIALANRKSYDTQWEQMMRPMLLGDFFPANIDTKGVVWSKI